LNELTSKSNWGLRPGGTNYNRSYSTRSRPSIGHDDSQPKLNTSPRNYRSDISDAQLSPALK